MKQQKKVLSRMISVVLVLVTVVSAVAFSAFGASALAESETASQYDYVLKIKTGDVKYGGTDSTVYLYAYNSAGERIGYAIRLLYSTVQNGTDIVRFSLPEKMESFKILIFYDRPFALTASHKSWYLDSIESECYVDSKLIAADRYTYDMWLKAPSRSETFLYDPVTSKDLFAEEYKYQLTVKTGNYACADTDAEVCAEITNKFGETMEANLGALQKNESKSFEFTSNYLYQQIKSVKLYLKGSTDDGWYFRRFEFGCVGENADSFRIAQDVYRWIEGDDSYVYVTDGSDAETDNYILSVKTGDVANAGTDARVEMKIRFSGGSEQTVNLSEIYPNDNAFEKGQDVKIGFCLEATEDEVQAVTFSLAGKYEGLEGSDWYLDSFSLTKTNGKKAGTIAEDTSVCQWVNDGYSYSWFANGVKGDKDNYLLKIKTGDFSFAGTDADVEMRISFDNGTEKTVDLSEIYPYDNAFEKGQNVTIGFGLNANESKINSVAIYLAGSGKSVSGNEWHFESFKPTKTTGANKGVVADEKVFQWINEDNSYCWFADGVKGDRDNYLLDIKVGDVSYGGTDDDVRMTVLFTDGTNCDLSLSEIYPHDNAFERNQQVTIGFSLPSKDCEMHTINFYSDKRGVSYDDWYLESFNFVKQTGANSGEYIKRDNTNQWIGDDCASAMYSKG